MAQARLPRVYRFLLAFVALPKLRYQGTQIAAPFSVPSHRRPAHLGLRKLGLRGVRRYVVLREQKREEQHGGEARPSPKNGEHGFPASAHTVCLSRSSACGRGPTLRFEVALVAANLGDASEDMDLVLLPWSCERQRKPTSAMVEDGDYMLTSAAGEQSMGLHGNSIAPQWGRERAPAALSHTEQLIPAPEE